MCITAKLIVEWQRLGPFSPDRHAPDALGMSASLRSLPKFGTRASLNRACRNLVPAFPQRSPPSLLTTAACGGLRSTPDSTSKGPPSSLVQLRTAVWTGGFRRKHTPGDQRNIKRAGGAPQYDALVESSVPQDLEQIVDRREISILRSGRREGFALPRLASDRCSVARAFRAALHKMSMFAANS